jgi:hypothetical protein
MKRNDSKGTKSSLNIILNDNLVSIQSDFAIPFWVRGKNVFLGLKENFLDYRVIFGEIDEEPYMTFSFFCNHTR